LRFHAGEKFRLLNPEALESAFHIVRHVLPIPFAGSLRSGSNGCYPKTIGQILARPMRRSVCS
jgi:hypothetical protein